MSARVRSLLPDIYRIIRQRRALLALGFVLMTVNRICALVLPGSTKYLIDDVISKHNIALLRPLLIAICLATLIQGITSLAFSRLLGRAGHHLIAELRCKVQMHVDHLPVAYYDANQTGTIAARIMNDVTGVRNLVSTALFDFVGSVVTTIAAVVILFVLSPVLTVAAVIVIVVQSAGAHQLMLLLKPIVRSRAEISGEVAGRLTQSLAGVRMIKGYCAEAREETAFSSGVARLMRNEITNNDTLALAGLAGTLFTGGIGIAVMYIGARQIFAGNLTLGELTTFACFLTIILAPISQMGGIVYQITEALTGIERTREVLSEKREDDDARRTTSLGQVRGEIRFQDVSFAFKVPPNVLEGISFKAEPGTITALVGPSGAGKSTIVSLIAAFYVPEKGTIRIDGVDLSTVKLESYRNQLGIVFQETFLFNGTIRENVAFSRPDAKEEEIMDACRIAHVDEFAERFEKGYESIVGERGVKLSGGQKQRISIARAILANAKILLFDEATSSLDSKSEVLIQDGLKTLMRGRTTFIIAHRLSTVRCADHILFLDGGRIVESGSHETLLARRGRYYELCSNQYNVNADLIDVPLAIDSESFK